MSSSTKRAAPRERPPAPAASLSVHPALVVLAAWLVPGAGHALTGRLQKAAIFFSVLVFMFAVGVAAGGRLFGFEPGDPLVLLAGISEWGLGLPRLVAAAGGFGQGTVVAASYEYGNTFLIAAGLINTLVVLDAYDRAVGARG
jgi:hypothetical protein